MAYMKGGEFFDMPSNCQIMKEDIAHGVVDLLGIGIISCDF
jgi:hypothetical protein